MTSSSALPIDGLKAKGKPIPTLISPRYILGNAQKWIYIRQSDMLSVKGSIVLRTRCVFLAFFFSLSNETRKRRKPSKSGEKQSQSMKEKNNPPVSSEAEALQGSFSNNCTMFNFPLKDYISAVQSIHSDWKHLINRNVFNCVERPWLI